VERIAILAGACGLLWIVEGRRPLFTFGPERARHVGPNLALAALTVLTNLGFVLALRPPVSTTSTAGPSWPKVVAAVVFLDFCAWVAHLLLHKTWWGWRTHRVHHSDAAVDVTTALRQHPAETVWRLLWRVAPAAILAVPLPALALYETLSVLNALLEHANVAVPEKADRLIRWVFVTPHMHKWHHSRNAAETDTNYGNLLSVWDRLFGTYTGDAGLARLRYGLEGCDGPDWQSLSGLLRKPLAYRINSTRS
jgi:sterol desaturase/sphingolipid hydroxylase (fatty acid hydroxylase superfamily)